MTDHITPQPKWGDVVPFYGDNWLDLPDAKAPYYVKAEEGDYLHTRSVLGRAIIRTHKTPPRLGKVGNNTGVFNFDGKKLPKEIIAQTVSFFRRIWDEHKTESAVIYTQNIDTGEYRIFVPTQRVSHGGVHYVYNAEHIAPRHLVVGTAHSHCNFGGNHSGTDDRDARGMDGVHLTIGMLQNEMPDAHGMIGFQKTLFKYENVADLADFSDLNSASAPAWWDQYMVFGVVTDEHRAKIAPYASDEDWEKFMGRWKEPTPVHSQPKPHISGHQYPNRAMVPLHNARTPKGSEDQWDEYAELGYIWDQNLRTWRWVGHGSQALHESEQFNNMQSRARGHEPQWGDKYVPPVWGPGGEMTNYAEMSDGELQKLLDGDDYWEDALGAKFVDNLLDTGLFTTDDLDAAIADWPESGTPAYWERRMKLKVIRATSWLRDQGFTVGVNIKPPQRPLPGQTEAFPEPKKGAHK